MKKHKLVIIFAFALVFWFVGSDASAQGELKQGDILAGAFLGFGHNYGGGVGIGINTEYSITDEIGIGGYFAYTRWDYGYGYGGGSYNYHYNFFDIGVRGSYHFGDLFNVRNKKFDPYASAYLGYLASSYTGDNSVVYTDPYGNKLRTGVVAGARYYFSDNFAGYAEAGYGVHLLAVGLTLKL
jgi:hypothetical protein